MSDLCGKWVTLEVLAQWYELNYVTSRCRVHPLGDSCKMVISATLINDFFVVVGNELILLLNSSVYYFDWEMRICRWIGFIANSFYVKALPFYLLKFQFMIEFLFCLYKKNQFVWIVESLLHVRLILWLTTNGCNVIPLIAWFIPFVFRYLSELLGERQKISPFMAVLPHCYRLLNQG
jgi:hypothetical protein